MRSNSALYAVSRSPVMRCRFAIAASESDCLPTTHWIPGVSMLSCPSVRELSNVGPMIFGALQNVVERTQSHAHAAYGFDGSCSGAFHSPHPHDHTDAIRVSDAPCAAESACHFATWYQAASGSRPLRPPKPFVVAKLTINPTFDDGMPTLVKSATAFRYAVRSRRLPSTGPFFHVSVAGT